MDNTGSEGNPAKRKWVYVLIAIIVVLVGVLLYNKVNSNNTDDTDISNNDSNADTNDTDVINEDVNNTDIEKTNVEAEKINVDINEFKHNTLSNSEIDFSFLGAIDNYLYGIGKGFSGDGLKEKLIFYEYKEKNGLDTACYTPGNTISNDGVIVNMFSVHSIGDNVYSYVDYNGKGNSINEISSYDFNTREEKVYKQVETNNEFVIYDAYVCGDDIYEYTHYKTGIDTISSEKKGVLKSYKSADYSFLATSDGDKFYYALSNYNDYNTEVYEDDVLICSFNVGDRIGRINHYKNYFVFESANNMYIYNESKGSVKEIQNVTCNYIYNNFIYDNKAYYISDGDIMYYDFSNDKIEKLVSLDEDGYKIVGINDDKVILHYDVENTLVEGLAVYSIGENKLYKYSELEGEVQIFYNDSYIIVVEKDSEKNQINKFEIKF